MTRSSSIPDRVPLAAGAFAVNLVWEVSHRPLYQCPFSPRVLAAAAAVDAVVTVGVAELAGAVESRYETSFWPMFATGLAAGAIAIEVSALVRGRRFYAPAMPTVAGLGLTPLLQLPLAGILAASTHEIAPHSHRATWPVSSWRRRHPPSRRLRRTGPRGTGRAADAPGDLPGSFAVDNAGGNARSAACRGGTWTCPAWSAVRRPSAGPLDLTPK